MIELLNVQKPGSVFIFPSCEYELEFSANLLKNLKKARAFCYLREIKSTVPSKSLTTSQTADAVGCNAAHIVSPPSAVIRGSLVILAPPILR